MSTLEDVFARAKPGDYLATAAAIDVAIRSSLPGRIDGPADAYRHLLWAGELTRRFGVGVARGILNFHEITGRWSNDHSVESESMDRHNNELGIAMGLKART